MGYLIQRSQEVIKSQESNSHSSLHAKTHLCISTSCCIDFTSPPHRSAGGQKKVVNINSWPRKVNTGSTWIDSGRTAHFTANCEIDEHHRCLACSSFVESLAVEKCEFKDSWTSAKIVLNPSLSVPWKRFSRSS